MGECGMSIEAARCPQCRVPVGGTNHTPLGVRSADDIERVWKWLLIFL